MSSHSSTFSSTSFTSSSSTVDGRTTSFSEERHSDPEGTTIYRTSQQPGEERKEERVRVPVERDGERSRIEDVSEKDGEDGYEERIEEEYAKREGGA